MPRFTPIRPSTFVLRLSALACIGSILACGESVAEVKKQTYTYKTVQNVTTDYPPTLMIHGEEDTDVPHEQSVMMTAELRRNNVEHKLISIPNGEHGLAGADRQAVDDAYRAAIKFVQQHLDSE